MRIILSGASGFLGGFFSRMATSKGHTIIPLVRDVSKVGIFWNPVTAELDEEALSGADAIVHLGGENIAAGRWSAARKQLLVESRVASTKLLSDKICQLAQAGKSRPGIFLVASAVGIYGEQGAKLVDEENAAGVGFLAELCQRWEEAAQPASAVGCRVGMLRFGVVLSRDGGALGKMLLPFSLGLGGRLGSGSQMMSWISREDAARAILFVLENSKISGAINVVAPQPVSNSEFTKVLGGLLRRPTLLTVPASLLRLAVGELADEALLVSQAIVPVKLLANGFQFQAPDISTGLRSALDRS